MNNERKSTLSPERGSWWALWLAFSGWWPSSAWPIRFPIELAIDLLMPLRIQTDTLRNEPTLPRLA